MNQHFTKKRMMPVLVMITCIVMTSCMTVRLIGGYDEQIDKGIMAFQKNMENHLLALETHIGKPEADHSKYIDFYRQAKVELSSLRVRAAAQPKNEITVEMVDLLSENVRILEQMHKEGLNPNDISPLRTAFNVGATAILKLELAKKRGEK